MVFRKLAIGACVASIAAAEGADKASAAQLLSASGTFDFVTKSVLLTKDITCFLIASGFWTALSFAPKDVQNQVDEGIKKVTSEVHSTREKMGIPAPSAVLGQINKVYAATFEPLIDNALLVVTKVTDVPVKACKKFIDAFEADYPQHKGAISGGIFDLSLVFFFMIYFVWGNLYATFCYIFCCGACAKRNGSPEIKKLGAKQMNSKKHR